MEGVGGGGGEKRECQLKGLCGLQGVPLGRPDVYTPFERVNGRQGLGFWARLCLWLAGLDCPSVKREESPRKAPGRAEWGRGAAVGGQWSFLFPSFLSQALSLACLGQRLAGLREGRDE